jgi:hypothetical protein
MNTDPSDNRAIEPLRNAEAGPLARVDHLVYAVPQLDCGIEHVERLLGVRATPGGRHAGRGTHNALVALGARTYLEIIGPDPEQASVSGPVWFGIDRLTEPTLVTWAVAASDLEGIAASSAQNGITLGNIISGGRTRTDGVELRWRYTDPLRLIADGIVPFFIDWADSPHPAQTAAQGASLAALRAEHPQPEAVREMLRGLGCEMLVLPAQQPALIATIDCPRGRIELR